ncbi:M48 family metallopeptidase [Litorisediminicola beolgyonensis]|uniref:M48 family metallopeptidase n=1 Tax=Litorisediminicola beolgyonensis TaxID=1173614 RepID=A0ABW3ZK82_9RHOB
MPCLCHAPMGRRRFLLQGAALALPLGTAGCDEAAVLVSEAEAAAMGEQAWAEVHSETPVTQDARFARVVQELSAEMLRAAGQNPDAWEVAAFETDRINAFALPGNKIGIFRGIYEVAETEAQLAAVIGHEIGHLQADHPRERMGNARAQGIIETLVAFFLAQSDIQFDREIMAALGLGLRYGLALPYSRNQELEADRLGLVTMTEAGFDPEEAAVFWQRMEDVAGDRGPEILGTHPAPASRIREIRAMLPELQET